MCFINWVALQINHNRVYFVCILTRIYMYMFVYLGVEKFKYVYSQIRSSKLKTGDSWRKAQCQNRGTTAVRDGTDQNHKRIKPDELKSGQHSEATEETNIYPHPSGLGRPHS